MSNRPGLTGNVRPMMRGFGSSASPHNIKPNCVLVPVTFPRKAPSRVPATALVLVVNVPTAFAYHE